MGKVRCLDCGDVIESLSRHDFVSCSCGESFVDGGDAYMRTGGNVVVWDDTSNDFLSVLTRDEELAKALGDINDYYDDYQEDQWSTYTVVGNEADEDEVIDNYEELIKQAKKEEAERIIRILDTNSGCGNWAIDKILQTINEEGPRPHSAGLTARYRYRQEGAQNERERIIDMLKIDRMCEHHEQCGGVVNIYDTIKEQYGIDLEKLITDTTK